MTGFAGMLTDEESAGAAAVDATVFKLVFLRQIFEKEERVGLFLATAASNFQWIF